MFFNKFTSSNTSSRSSRDYTIRTATFNAEYQWSAYKYVFTKPTIVNGFYYYLNTRPTVAGQTRSFTAGISTSLGVNGMFPYVISEELMNANAGVAKTIAFTIETSTITVDTTVFQNATLYQVPLSQNFTCDPFVSYHIGVKMGAGNGTILLGEFNTNQIIDNSQVSFVAAPRTDNTSNNTLLDSVLVIPYYYNASTGQTIIYSKYPVALRGGERTYHPGAASPIGREFGIKFKINDLSIQDWEVNSVIVRDIDANALDAQFCLRIYDGTNFDNVIGTGLTLTSYDVGNTLFANPATWEWVFSPPLKLRTNKTYFAGIAWTQPTTVTTSGGSVIDSPYNYKLLTSNQSSLLAWRNTQGSGALTEDDTAKPSISFYIKNTSPVSRAIGN